MAQLVAELRTAAAQIAAALGSGPGVGEGARRADEVRKRKKRCRWGGTGITSSAFSLGVLKKNGICIFTTPNKKMGLKSQQKPWNHFHVREYNGLELRQTLEQIFSKIEIYGIYGSPSIQKIETQRIAKIQKLLRLDPLGIRLLLPESWKQKLVLLMRLITQKHTPEKIDYTKSLNVDDFYISPNTDESLDILAVCTKKS